MTAMRRKMRYMGNTVETPASAATPLEATAEQQIVEPTWTLGWRLQRALAHADIGAGQMAEELGVARATVSRWMNDHGAPPKLGYLRLWALRCGVPLEWLRGRDSNPQPSG